MIAALRRFIRKEVHCGSMCGSLGLSRQVIYHVEFYHAATNQAIDTRKKHLKYYFPPFLYFCVKRACSVRSRISGTSDVNATRYSIYEDPN